MLAEERVELGTQGEVEVHVSEVERTELQDGVGEDYQEEVS